ncbi:hypothetical protein CsatB_024118 [Cannabis sativa]
MSFEGISNLLAAYAAAFKVYKTLACLDNHQLSMEKLDVALLLRFELNLIYTNVNIFCIHY